MRDAGEGAEDAYYGSIKSNESLRKEGEENMSDMREAFSEPGEIQLLDLKRTRPILIPVDPAPIRKKRNRAVRGLMAALAASLLLNAAQAVIIYVLQAGPI